MASGLPHPVLLSTFVDMDTITLGGQTIEFKHVFYTWIAMAIMPLSFKDFSNSIAKSWLL